MGSGRSDRTSRHETSDWCLHPRSASYYQHFVALMVRGVSGMRKSLKLVTANSSIHLQHEPRGDRFGSVAQTIVPKNSVDVSANRRIGYPDLSGNLLVREPFGHQGENLRPARREMLPPHWYQNLR